ncbi:hypothetical protein O181_094512 [Austropuccinia psidii MF-1]|uniref:Uncharacterized protein n=1 Tax=Austropuccinia psidii MF-1 TaxID=1389203 RepID=A0A9Q3PBK7_9BASI|nr:hypothetical protein [Austropuccinia psidii MF-1]
MHHRNKVFASDLIINVLQAKGLELNQPINLRHQLPQFRSPVACGPYLVIFVQSISNSLSWTLHSSFTSYISRILFVKLKKSHCLISGQDGLFLYQLSGDPLNLADSTWIIKSSFPGYPRDYTDFDILDDEMCLIAPAKLSETSSNLDCSIILCPPTTAGQVCSITIPLANLFIDKDISNSFSQSLAIQKMPYGFTLASPPSFQYHSDSDCIELLMIVSTQDSSTKRLCACTKAERQGGPPT